MIYYLIIFALVFLLIYILDFKKYLKTKKEIKKLVAYLQTIAKNSGYAHFGFRWNNIKLQNGCKLFNSHNYICEPPILLDGTSSVYAQNNHRMITEKSIIKAIALLFFNHYYEGIENYIVFIGGNIAKEGEAIGEILIRDAYIIANSDTLLCLITDNILQKAARSFGFSYGFSYRAGEKFPLEPPSQ